MAIWGGKKKIMKALKEHQEKFYENFEKEADGLT